MNWKTMTSAVATGCLMALAAASATAGEFCITKPVCSKGTDTCHGGYCVPTSKLCTGDAACKSFQKCSFSCPKGGTTVSDSLPPPPSQDGGSSGGSSTDASSGAPMPPPDASSEKKAPPPADAFDFAPPDPDAGSSDSSTPEDVASPPNCPKNPGVCVADPIKVTVQPGCEALCKGFLGCDLGGASSGGSGGSGSADAGGSSATDAGSSGFAPKPPADGGGGGEQDPVPQADANAATDVGEPPNPDAGGPGPDGDMKECVFICSVWKLEQVAPIELASLEKCVANNQAQCSAMKTKCQDGLAAFTSKALEDDSWLLGLDKFMDGSTAVPGGDAGPAGGDTENSADTTSGTVDASVSPDGTTLMDAAAADAAVDAANPPKGSDAAASADGGAISAADATSGSDGATAKDSAATGGTSNAAPKDDGGCTAARSGHGDATGLLAMLASLGAMLFLRRRLAVNS